MTKLSDVPEIRHCGISITGSIRVPRTAGSGRFFVKVRTSAWFSPGRGVTGYYEFKMVDKYPMTVVLSGSFGVKGGSLTALPEKINTQLAWNSQGFPFFAGTGVYRQKFFLNRLPKRAVLRISAVRGTVSVTVNRYCAGAKAWGPRFAVPQKQKYHFAENQ